MKNNTDYMERRDFIRKLGTGIAGSYIAGGAVAAAMSGGAGSPAASAAEFPALPYAYNALEPHIDAMTMEIHYDRHHRGYFNNYLKAVSGTDLEKMTLENLFAEVSKHGDAVRNNAGGFYNHSLFWNNMSPQAGKPSDELMAAIKRDIGSMEDLKSALTNAGATRFGSGWAWLVADKSGKLTVGSTPNQDNPLMDLSPLKGTPLLALDVWEHAYYLKYQNKRGDYLNAFWNVINWTEVSKRYAKIK